MPLPLSGVPLRLETSASGKIKRNAAQRQAAESMKPALPGHNFAVHKTLQPVGCYLKPKSDIRDSNQFEFIYCHHYIQHNYGVFAHLKK